jgi:hypothetical protein
MDGEWRGTGEIASVAEEEDTDTISRSSGNEQKRKTLF